MQNRSFFRSPFGIAAIVCFVIALASPFLFIEVQSVSKQEEIKAATPTPSRSVSPSATQNFEEQAATVQGATTNNNSSVTPTVTSATSTSQTVQVPVTATPVPTSIPAKQTFQVSLSINGSSVGTVDMEEGNNQCDVLSHAKDQGKISSLLMKYDNSLGTNGVYQINGVGKENVVWWVYKVNGTSPTQGCSFIKANSGENIEWEYKG